MRVKRETRRSAEIDDDLVYSIIMEASETARDKKWANIKEAVSIICKRAKGLTVSATRMLIYRVLFEILCTEAVSWAHTNEEWTIKRQREFIDWLNRYPKIIEKFLDIALEKTASMHEDLDIDDLEEDKESFKDIQQAVEDIRRDAEVMRQQDCEIAATSIASYIRNWKFDGDDPLQQADFVKWLRRKPHAIGVELHERLSRRMAFFVKRIMEVR